MIQNLSRSNELTFVVRKERESVFFLAAVSGLPGRLVLFGESVQVVGAGVRGAARRLLLALNVGLFQVGSRGPALASLVPDWTADYSAVTLRNWPRECMDQQWTTVLW